MSVACNKNIVKNLETLQKDALRIIFKRTVLDHVEAEDLRKWAGFSSTEVRHAGLLTRYYERAIMSKSPPLKKLFENY